jgi:ribosomal-protein-alanine N-acetyltransferase
MMTKELHSKRNTNVTNFEIFLSGKMVNLVVVTRELAENSLWYTWFNDEATTAGMQKHYFPNTRELQSHYFETELKSNPTKIQLGIVTTESKSLIGMISLAQIDHLNQKCEIGGLIGDKDFRKMDYWIEANQILINHAFETLNMNRIYGGSITRAVEQFYVRVLGFESEGTSKSDVFRNGKFVDTYRFAKIRIQRPS